MKIESKILKQIHDKKLAESFTPITNKLEKIDKFTKEIGEKFENLSQTAKKRPNLLYKVLKVKDLKLNQLAIN